MSEEVADIAELNWEDFDDAISDEDCFGSHCGSASAALSLMQKGAVIGHKVVPVKVVGEQKPTDKDSETGHEDWMDELGEEMEGALALVQTGATVERKSIAASSAPMAVAAQADGTFEMNPHQAVMPEDGIMHFSVDGHGDLHSEDGAVSLIQKDLHMERPSVSSSSAAVEKAEGALKIRKSEANDKATAAAIAQGDGADKLHKAVTSHDAAAASVAQPKGALKLGKALTSNQVKKLEEETASLSLMQTDVSFEPTITTSQHASVTGAVQADGSIELNPRAAAVPSDGMMTFSVDGHGDFHSEEGLSLMQTSVQPVETVSESSSAEAPWTPLEEFSADGHPSWTFEALEDESVDGLALVQTDAHIEHKVVSSAVQADGSLEMNPHKAAVPKDGVMHLSVDTHGAFHVEM